MENKQKSISYGVRTHQKLNKIAFFANIFNLINKMARKSIRDGFFEFLRILRKTRNFKNLPPVHSHSSKTQLLAHYTSITHHN